MLYTSLIRPALFHLDADRAHEIGLAVAQCVSGDAWLCQFVHDAVSRPKTSPRTVAGLKFPNPVGLAAGLDKNAVAPRAWWAFGFGFIELGTITPKPQPGNPRPRMFRDIPGRAIVNRMGFNNDGAEVVARRLSEQTQSGRRPPIPIGISVGKNKTTPLDRAADDYVAAIETLAPHADFLTINISSPNTPGLRTLQTPEALTSLIVPSLRAAAGKPLFVKLAPELDGDDLRSVIDRCADCGVAGIIATNTLGTPSGGLSGRPLGEISLQRVATIRKFLPDRLALIGCGGIDDAASAQAMLDAGADLVQLYTGLIYEGPLLPARITRQL